MLCGSALLELTSRLMQQGVAKQSKLVCLIRGLQAMRETAGLTDVGGVLGTDGLALVAMEYH